jgi:hypothetical protein
MTRRRNTSKMKDQEKIKIDNKSTPLHVDFSGTILPSILLTVTDIAGTGTGSLGHVIHTL